MNNVVYLASYFIFNASHNYAVLYNILGTNYELLTNLTTAYTAVCVAGWLITNANTYKHEWLIEFYHKL